MNAKIRGIKNQIQLELSRLTRRALASMRCAVPDLHEFEITLHEIQLLDIQDDEKAEVLYNIGLEVSLNSAEGTKLLVDQFLFLLDGWPQIATVAGNLKKSEQLLDLLAGYLNDLGVQAVEYQGKLESVEACADCLLKIKELAKIMKLKKPEKNCINAIDGMIETAVMDKRETIGKMLNKKKVAMG